MINAGATRSYPVYPLARPHHSTSTLESLDRIELLGYEWGPQPGVMPRPCGWERNGTVPGLIHGLVRGPTYTEHIMSDEPTEALATKPGYKSTEFFGLGAAGAAMTPLLQDPNPWVRVAAVAGIAVMTGAYAFARTKAKKA